MSISIKIFGLDKLSKQFKALVDNTPVALNDIVEDVSNRIIDTAKANVPVKTGTLRDSLYVMSTDDGSYTITSNVPYAADVEYGFVSKDGKFTPGIYFLHTAVEENKPNIESVGKQYLSELLKDAERYRSHHNPNYDMYNTKNVSSSE